MTNDKTVHTDSKDGQGPAPTPGDVASLCTWANLEALKYRDFSDSRTRSRAQTLQPRQPEKPTPPPETETVAVDAPRNIKPVATERVSPIHLRARNLSAVPSSKTPPQAGPTPRASQRWSALKNIFQHAEPPLETQPPSPVALDIPAMAFVSLAGGVGKTSLVASLGASLAAQGEKVLLVDTSAYSLLPLYFRPCQAANGIVRTCATHTNAAPIFIMTLERDGDEGAPPAEHELAEKILHHSRGMHRVLIDVSTASAALIREVFRLAPSVVVTSTPDMASVVSLHAVQELFGQLSPEVEPFFLLNKFDAAQRLHRDIRALLARQLGDRLLPAAIHRSNAFSEALAEGMTVVDYAPGSPEVEDLIGLTQWIRELDEHTVGALPNIRWRKS